MKLAEIQLEVVGRCNASCGYCTWQKRSVGKQVMPTDLALSVLDQARAMGVGSVTYHGLGEPLLHPDIVSILRHGVLFNSRISTNCSLLEGDLARELATVPLQLILAIPWVMPDRFVDRCVENVKTYLDLDYVNQVIIQMVCVEGAEGHYDRLLDTFLPLVERRPRASIYLKQPLTWPNDSPNRGFVRPFDHPLVRYDAFATPVSIGVGCQMPEFFLQVLADGTCVPCCVGMDDWGLGKVQDLGLAGVWESAVMGQLRQKCRTADDSVPCGHCKRRTDCAVA